jgi:hypothetical protein
MLGWNKGVDADKAEVGECCTNVNTKLIIV